MFYGDVNTQLVPLASSVVKVLWLQTITRTDCVLNTAIPSRTGQLYSYFSFAFMKILYKYKRRREARLLTCRIYLVVV